MHTQHVQQFQPLLTLNLPTNILALKSIIILKTQGFFILLQSRKNLHHVGMITIDAGVNMPTLLTVSLAKFQKSRI